MRNNILITVFTFLFSQFSFILYAQTDSSVNHISLFSQTKSVSHDLQKADDELWRDAVEINEAIFTDRSVEAAEIIDVNLNRSESIRAKVLYVETDVAGTRTISAQISGEIPGSLILTHNGDRLFGTLHIYNQHRIFHIKSDPKMGDSYIAELDHSKLAPFECGGVEIVDEELFNENEPVFDSFKKN